METDLPTFSPGAARHIVRQVRPNASHRGVVPRHDDHINRVSRLWAIYGPHIVLQTIPGHERINSSVAYIPRRKVYYRRSFRNLVNLST